MENKNTCKTCKYWELQEDSGHAKDYGICTRLSGITTNENQNDIYEHPIFDDSGISTWTLDMNQGYTYETKSWFGCVHHKSTKQHLPIVIDQVVSEVMEIPVETLRKRTNKRSIADPRHLAMFFYRYEADLTFRQIGEKLGGFDHSTVYHAIKNVNNLRETDPAFRRKFEKINKKITERLN